MSLHHYQNKIEINNSSQKVNYSINDKDNSLKQNEPVGNVIKEDYNNFEICNNNFEKGDEKNSNYYDNFYSYYNWHE